MKVLMVEPGKVPYAAEIGEGLEPLQAAVGGDIQAVYPYDDPVALICNEEGKYMGLPLNRALHDDEGNIYDIVAGNFFLCGLGEEDLTDLPADLMEKYRQQSEHPEQFVRIAGKILAVKQPVPSPEEQEAQRAQMAAQEAQREEMRLDESTDLAFDLDVFLRQYSDAYADMHPVFHEEKERMADELLSGQTGKIRMRMATVIQEEHLNGEAGPLLDRIAAYEKEYGISAYSIYQLDLSDSTDDLRFMSLDWLEKKGLPVDRDNYQMVYAAELSPGETLEDIYTRFNIDHPEDFKGHSLSVSDVVVLHEKGSDTAYYVDSIGFAELPDFFKERNLDLQKENLLNEELQEIEIFDKSGLFSNGRLRDEDVPEGLYRYDLRGSDYDPGQPITVEKTVVVNHAASVLMAEELDLGAKGRLELGEEGLNFTGAELTVREFMEEQQQKRNGLIHGDSDHIAVEGHIGTWYAVDETKVGGKKFFLLEHEEHGDMAACVAVNEQGKLVAEDLWNGFDEDFQEAVQKYFSEKWNMPKKEDVVSEIIEKAVPVPDNSAQDYSDVPVYYEPFSYAKENDEVDLYRTSYRLNSECKQAIHEAIADNYDGMYLGDDAVDQVVRQYGMERVGYILANTLHHKSYDGRFSHSNKEWAEQVSTPEHNVERMTFRTDWVVDSHPAELEGFVKM